ncbi:MAG: SCO family protein [Silicimonas sp.]|nr:SCO family protein [Silicimonas sp.]
MTKLSAILSAFVLVAIVGGTAVYTYVSRPADCGVTSVVGASIGGPFELVNASSETVTDSTVIDRPALVYFGYTFCPDVCPFDMARNALAVDLLKEQGHDVALVFVSIDPKRDTPEVLAGYAFDMHPEMIALSGTAAQVKTAADAYRVYYARGEGDDEFYLMDHSTFTYLMFPDNQLGALFKRDDTAETIAEQTACLIKSR